METETITIEIEVPKIEGYEYPRRLEIINEGDEYLNGEGLASVWHLYDSSNFLGLVLKKKVWRADIREQYFYVGDDGIDFDFDDMAELDNKRFNDGNYYQTRELAKPAWERVKKAYRGEE